MANKTLRSILRVRVRDQTGLKFGNGGQIVFAVMSNLANVGSYGNLWNHYSLLRTLEDGLGVSGYVGNADTATPINTVWK